MALNMKFSKSNEFLLLFQIAGNSISTIGGRTTPIESRVLLVWVVRK